MSLPYPVGACCGVIIQLFVIYHVLDLATGTPNPDGVPGALFLGAKIVHLAELPQGRPERRQRVVDMVAQHDAEGFGGCTNTGQCTVACPTEIPLDVIATLNRDYRLATTGGRRRDVAWRSPRGLPHTPLTWR